MPLLTATDLTYHAQDRVLLNHITLTLNHGQKVALVGRSGSGKSLLLQALADLLPITGDIKLNINGTLTPLTQIPPADYRFMVALFHQSPQLTDGTVLDNLKAPFAFSYHRHRRFDADWHLDKLSKLGKPDTFLSQPVQKLSGGERQIVSFLRTLQFNPTIALFDESTAALDHDSAHQLIQLALDWHDSSKAFIWVTHSPNQAHQLHAKLWQMNQGVLMA